MKTIMATVTVTALNSIALFKKRLAGNPALNLVNLVAEDTEFRFKAYCSYLLDWSVHTMPEEDTKLPNLDMNSISYYAEPGEQKLFVQMTLDETKAPCRSLLDVQYQLQKVFEEEDCYINHFIVLELPNDPKLKALNSYRVYINDWAFEHMLSEVVGTPVPFRHYVDGLIGVDG